MGMQGVAFGVIAALAFAGADYVVQSRKAEVSPSEFGLAAYVGSIKGRVAAGAVAKAEARALAARQAEPARSHLPAAPEGWTRRGWVAADAERFLPDGMAAQKEALADLASSATALGGTPEGLMQKIANTAWIYERGDEAVMIRADFTGPARNGTFSGQMMQVALGNMAAMTDVEGFAFIEGVGFVQSAMFFVEEPEEGAEAPLSLTAQFGQDEHVSIAVEAYASAEAVRALLGEIDYDALNAMLTEPDPNVGSHMPAFEVAEQVALAEMTAEERLATLAARGTAAEAAAVAQVEEKGVLGSAMGEVAARMGFSPAAEPVELPEEASEAASEQAPAVRWSCTPASGGAKRCTATTE